MLPSLGGALGAAGDSFTYGGLQEKYLDFAFPQAAILLGAQAFSSKSGDLIIGDIHVEVTCGFESSVASFRIYDVFDSETGSFAFQQVAKQVVMGNSLEIQLGYSDKLSPVFVGFVSGVAFGYEPEGLPYIEVTGMDVKGLMMGGVYSAQLKATTYSAAVREILDRTGQDSLKQLGGIKELSISDTPDAKRSSAGGKASAETVEMTAESDYEFVVKAAKRFNFEFFVDRGRVLFRPAKSDAVVQGKLGIRQGIQGFHIAYSITGVVGSIEARAMDPGKGQLISAKSSFHNAISTANKAKSLVGKGSKVYVDATISSKEDAESRVASLMERMSYRLGSLEATCVGIPELTAGRFIDVSGMGVPVDNRFYLTSVIHDFSSDSGYRTRIEGCAAKIQTTAPAGL